MVFLLWGRYDLNQERYILDHAFSPQLDDCKVETAWQNGMAEGSHSVLGIQEAESRKSLRGRGRD